MPATLVPLRPHVRHADNRTPEAWQQMANAAAIMIRAGGTPEQVRILGMPISGDLAAAMERQQARVTS